MVFRAVCYPFRALRAVKHIRRIASGIGRRARAFSNLASLEQEVAELREQLDLLKSHVEVPTTLVDEFHTWKTSRSVPSTPLVSVCVGTYNRGRLLAERCIPSILGQTYRNLELIVVGDACTDDTAERIAQFNDPRLRFVNLPVRGPYPEDPKRRWMVAGTNPMNRAMELAQGDFITHLDDDDEHVLDRIEKLVSFATSNSYDFVWHPFWWEMESGEWILREAEEFAFRQVTTSSVFYRSWFTRIRWDVNAHRLLEPGDWNRFRRIKFIGPVAGRYPEPLLRHYRERGQARSGGSTPVLPRQIASTR